MKRKLEQVDRKIELSKWLENNPIYKVYGDSLYRTCLYNGDLFYKKP